MKMILQKAIASTGHSSRRKAEEMIRAGLVKINGRLATIGDMADPAADQITINGRLLHGPASFIYLKLNKPAGYTCTNRSFAGENNIFELIDLPERLFAVGRLDKDSRGLILLTNDGDLNLKLSHPRYQHEKKYEVKLSDIVADPAKLISRLRRGVDIGEGDGLVKARDVQHLQNNEFVITLSEGKKRQIRRMFETQGLKVQDLRRIAIGSLTLGSLAEGRWAYLTGDELRRLKQE